jgi:hypothetical protein
MRVSKVGKARVAFQLNRRAAKWQLRSVNSLSFDIRKCARVTGLGTISI